GQMYMAVHQHDTDANDLWLYFQTVINWAKTLFPKAMKGITDSQDWGLLYNAYKDNTYNSNTLADEIRQLIMDDDVTRKSGIIPYLLSGRTKHDEKSLSIRAFTESQKLKAYERQGHKCPMCQANGIDTEYAYDEMEGDHIIPWSKGGHTIDGNLQMLCQKCNNDKRAS
nr:HNH endonuclease [Saccharofermentans sp.]